MGGKPCKSPLPYGRNAGREVIRDQAFEQEISYERTQARTHRRGRCRARFTSTSLNISEDIGLGQPGEMVGPSDGHAPQERAGELHIGLTGPRAKTAPPRQIHTEVLKYLVGRTKHGR